MKHRILVVEDNPLNRIMLCDWLQMEGYEVAEASGLDVAWQALHRWQPHLVLLDVKLGEEDGLALATRMRKEASLSRIPVIVVTAHAMVTEQERIYQSGCNAYISKPIDFKVLQEKMRRWLPVPQAVPQDS